MFSSPRIRLLAVLLAAALASACGPGSGGTGTGSSLQTDLSAFGATAASLCGSDLASSLTCEAPSGASGPLPSDIGTGTQMTHYADLTGGGNVAVTFLAHSVNLRARCQRISFDGDWGVVTGQDARFFGNYVIETVGAPVQASISVQSLSTKGDALQVVLRESDGRVVLGPLVLQKVATPVAQPAACP